MSIRKRLIRWAGLLRVGVRRTVSRTLGADQRRMQLSVLGVAAIIALLVIVTGLGLGLATGTTVYDDDIDYWVVPEDSGSSSPLLATDNPRFGSVHDATEQFRSDDVTFATPVLSQVLQVETDGETEYILVMGVINEPGLDSVTGVATTGITDGDPYYDDGSYSGEWTGDAVLSQSAAGLLEADSGSQLTIAGNDSFTVTNVDDGADSVGDVPAAVVQLSELQTLTGAAENDQADQFIVGTNSPAVETTLEGVYPQSEVLTRGELTTSAAMDSELPLALALTAFIISVSVGTLFVLTTNGLEVVADRTQLATLAAIGISTRSQLTLVGTQTLVITGAGGLLGALVGMGGIWGVNAAAMEFVTTEPIALSEPWFILYGGAVGLIIGILSLPYLLLLTRRVTGGVP
ncbi:ABC transporter permease [Natronolimnobius sp. AArcel1]|uniref:ABC transporter permease n=1 Tax=Natronolimnobius sp. AArcel1 TaxID=1679093 RepID=UPI0013EA2B12|nr:ABC transporter permease [Natronolimnobius sp. AArcel1]NGM70758.1 ABC transporter permease [Natronolimnobius sp. AArcel1]